MLNSKNKMQKKRVVDVFVNYFVAVLDICLGCSLRDPVLQTTATVISRDAIFRGFLRRAACGLYRSDRLDNTELKEDRRPRHHQREWLNTQRTSY